MQENKLITVKDISFNIIKVEGNASIPTFFIGETEVTQGLWRAVTNKNPSFFKKGDDYPVELVSYNHCLDFLQKLNRLTGLYFRLPSEAEWEFAARGGNQSNGYLYAGSNDIDAVAWYAGNSDNSTNPVAQKQPNELGLYDMTGNVWEWCEDRYDRLSGSERVMRGASWSTEHNDCLLTNRCGFTPTLSTINFGLRLALNQSF